MGYIIAWPKGGYVLKTDGMNLKVKNPRDATAFQSREEASNMRPGHHRDMGGHGFVGYPVDYYRACQHYDWVQQASWRR